MNSHTSNNLASANLSFEVFAVYRRVEPGERRINTTENGKGNDQRGAYCSPLWNWSVDPSS